MADDSEDRGFGYPPQVDSDSDKDEFMPREMAWLIDDYLTTRFNRAVGFTLATVYAIGTMGLAALMSIGLAVILTTSESAFSTGSSMALIAVTVGMIVLMTGTSLVDHFDAADINFSGYVHNTITSS